MSETEREDTRIERLTMYHADTRVATLTAYVEIQPLGETSGFPVSGDMLGIIRQMRGIFGGDDW